MLTSASTHRSLPHTTMLPSAWCGFWLQVPKQVCFPHSSTPQHYCTPRRPAARAGSQALGCPAQRRPSAARLPHSPSPVLSAARRCRPPQPAPAERPWLPRWQCLCWPSFPSSWPACQHPLTLPRQAWAVRLAAPLAPHLSPAHLSEHQAPAGVCNKAEVALQPLHSSTCFEMSCSSHLP